ncbi:MAG: WD40 repeat domain-containing protein, partial [Isosphaeraceae bacterium]
GSTVLAGTSLGNILRFDAATHLLIGPPIPGHRRAIGGLAMRTDGGGFASVGLDGAILEWDLSGPTALARPLVIAPAPMTSLAYSRDGSVLATGLADGTIHMWGADTGSPLGALDGDGSVVQSVTFGEAETIASGTEDGSVFLWQKDGGSSARTQLAKGGAQVSAVAFDREGDTLAAASSDGTIHLWNTATGEASGSALDAGLGPVAGVAFSPDGETLAAATEGAGETGNGGGVILWNLHTLTERRTLTYGGGDPVSVAISPDGRVLAVGTFDGAVVLWDMRTLQRIGQPLTAQSKWITTVAFSPDGRTLASGSWDGTVALWDVVARRLLGQPLGVRDNTIVRTVAFRPPVGNTLASVGGETMTIGLAISGGMPGVVWAWSDVLWSSDSRSLIDRLCGVAGRNMSASEWAEYLPGRPYSKTCALKPEGD